MKIAGSQLDVETSKELLKMKKASIDGMNSYLDDKRDGKVDKDEEIMAYMHKYLEEKHLKKKNEIDQIKESELEQTDKDKANEGLLMWELVILCILVICIGFVVMCGCLYVKSKYEQKQKNDKLRKQQALAGQNQ